ncbi:hypothetical protein PL263_10330 [Methylomonas sp. EFPC3]|uniref:hypothetical protein n=1 Tax=Methylomonas sp. EFPC3 TaxID=3021710 RepID=UPI0024165B07|nr:hypothetical protein [Methylomonas sp. EFPC3]WFP48509.1 hypothetical protein PL263_10330 [Methylomonas sp. EFPC3]
MPGGTNQPQPDQLKLAVDAWNIMGGLDWAGLPVVAELLGVQDIESLIYHLKLIRDQNHVGP